MSAGGVAKVRLQSPARSPSPLPSLSLLALPLLLLLLLPARAAAQSAADLERAKESFRAGAVAYAAGEYLAAIQALEAAYALTPLPAIAFSLAQAERKQYFVAHEREHLDRAITLFRRYVDQVPSGGRRVDALDNLSQLEPLAAAPQPPGSAAPPTAAGSPAPGSVPAPVRPTRLMITAEAPGARVALDGGNPAPSPLIREVEPGKHRVEIAAPGFFPATREPTAVAGELIPVAVTLTEQPSAVAIAAPAGAELYVDGVFAGRGGPLLTLLLPSGPHRLTAAKNGQRVSSQTLELERGQTRDVQVTFQATRQRAAARLLFVGGGAALGAGVVFAVLGVRAQHRAEDFLASQARGNVSQEALADYAGDVTDRDRYRVAAGIALISAVSLGITGLLLYQMDHPDQQEVSGGTPYPGGRSPRGDSPPPPEASGSARVVPLAVTGGYGLLLSATF